MANTQELTSAMNDDVLTKRQIAVLDSLIADLEQHHNHALCKRSQAEKWTRPMKNPYFDVNAQTRRARRTYEPAVARVFKDAKARFLHAFDLATQTILSDEMLRAPQKNANPLARAIRARTLRKDVTQSEWQKIADYTTADIPDTLRATLVSNALLEMGIVSNEIVRNIVKLHARVQIDPTANLAPQHSIDFLNSYELQLSQRTKEQVDGRLKDIIREGLVRGSSNQDIRDEIVKHFNTLTRQQAFTIARTETIRASGEGSKAAYVAAGIKQVDLLPALDACPICVDLASKNPYAVGDRDIALPIHPNCRCALVPIVGGVSVFDPSLYPQTFETDGGNPTFTKQ